MEEILRTINLKKYFGSVKATDGVNLSIKRGQTTSIIGPNGAGKTTLINLLTGNIYPDSGKVFFMTQDITREPIHKRVKMGIGRSFQIQNIFPNLTVYQNIQIPLFALFNKSFDFFKNTKSYPEVKEKADSLLSSVGLLEKKDVPAGKLSHGDQRLLEIALSLAPEPRLLFLDEPTAGMNPLERITVLENLKNLAKGKDITIVIVEHDMDVVFMLSERIVVLHRGQILADGSPDEIKANRDVRDIYLGEETL